MAYDAHVDEPVQRRMVRQSHEDRIGPDLPTVRHPAVLHFQEHIAEHGSLGDDALQHLVVHDGADRLLEPAEFPIQSGWLELPPDWSDLADVDPADPQVLGQEAP